MKIKPKNSLRVSITKILGFIALFALIISYYVSFGYEAFIYALAIAAIAVLVCMM